MDATGILRVFLFFLSKNKIFQIRTLPIALDRIWRLPISTVQNWMRILFALGRFPGYLVYGVESRVKGVGLGLGYGVWGIGCWVLDVRVRVRVRFRVRGLGLSVGLGLGLGQSLGSGVGFGFWFGL
jgi:hypothetical protein